MDDFEADNKLNELAVAIEMLISLNDDISARLVRLEAGQRDMEARVPVNHEVTHMEGSEE
jgi:hypothetical protein